MQEVELFYAAITTALLIGLMGTLYCKKIVRGDANPPIATWIIFEIGVVMSLVTYFSSREHSAIASITNVSDGAVVSAILLTLFLKHQKEGIVLSPNHRWCIGIAVVALILWTLTRMSWVGVMGFQVVMSVAYIPTFERLWHHKPGAASEPADVWGVNVFTAALGILIAVAKHDYVAMMYPLRACILCVVVIALILRWNQKNAFHCAI